jgi:multiple sugar transport system ATP-binding protein
MATVTLRNVRSGAEELNLEIRDREFVVLAGPLDSGSATILRMIAGLEEVPQGEIHLGDRRIDELPAKDRDVALVSHDYAPYPRLSVYENLAFGLKRRKFAPAEIKKRIGAVAEILGLQGQLERKARSLSGEERQFVALAAGMVRQPKVFLFDQPFSGLAPEAQLRGRAEIKKLHQRFPATMIYATHEPAEALALGERLVILNHGVVQQDAKTQFVYDSPANMFAAGFAGAPPMNLVEGTLKQERDTFLFSEAGDGTIEARLPISRVAGAKDFIGKPVVLGIRPEAIEIRASTGGSERPAASFRALVDRVEPMGAHSDLHLVTGAHKLLCRSHQWVDSGEGGHRFEFEIQVEKAYLFDPATGARIMAEP